jgi:hypothetical protein
MKSSRFCLTVVRCMWWWCMYRKIIFKQIVEDYIVGTMVCCKMDSVSRFLDDHDETWGCITAYNSLNNCIRTDCSRNVFYQIISHSLNLLVNQYVIRSFSYPTSQFVSQRQPVSRPVYHISELAIKPVNQPLIKSTIQSCHSVIRLSRNSASYKPVSQLAIQS